MSVIQILLVSFTSLATLDLVFSGLRRLVAG
jgi:hypothetical protein